MQYHFAPFLSWLSKPEMPTFVILRQFVSLLRATFQGSSNERYEGGTEKNKQAL